MVLSLSKSDWFLQPRDIYFYTKLFLIRMQCGQIEAGFCDVQLGCMDKVAPAATLTPQTCQNAHILTFKFISTTPLIGKKLKWILNWTENTRGLNQIFQEKVVPKLKLLLQLQTFFFFSDSFMIVNDQWSNWKMKLGISHLGHTFQPSNFVFLQIDSIQLSHLQMFSY